jgi:hypothetical protein
MLQYWARVRGHDPGIIDQGAGLASRTAARHSIIRANFAVTRHGLPQFPTAARPLRPTLELEPSVVSDAATPSRR